MTFTKDQLRVLCASLEPTFRAEWVDDPSRGRIFKATMRRDGKPLELSMCASYMLDVELTTLQSCYEHLNRGKP